MLFVLMIEVWRDILVGGACLVIGSYTRVCCVAGGYVYIHNLICNVCVCVCVCVCIYII